MSLEQGHFYHLTPTPVKSHSDHQNVKTLRRARILVVEDDIHLMEGVREILELDDYEVVTASSGMAGLKVLEEDENPPDLIVSDIMMPKMTGYEFFEKVRAQDEWISIPFIFLTAKGEKSDIRLGKAMGADDYVTKPFGAEDLLIAVNSKLERNKQLQTVLSTQVSDIKRKILTMLNHEFRTPLTYVVAYADMLHRDADMMQLGEMREFLKGVSSGADRLRRLVENFIYLVEMETGEIHTSFNWRKKTIVDYKAVIKDAIKNIEPVMAERKQTLQTTVDPDVAPIMGDWEYLTVGLARLVDNASKFSPNGAQIDIRVFVDNMDRPSIAIQDYGRGIPEGEIDRIFDSFYQIDRQRYEDQGSGSGLAIVRGVAQVHGAEISVRSMEGEGSTFTLHFQPLKQDVLN